MAKPKTKAEQKAWELCCYPIRCEYTCNWCSMTAAKQYCLEMYQWTKEQFLNTDFIMKILQLNSNIQDRSNPHWIAEQILKQLEEQYDNQNKE